MSEISDEVSIRIEDKLLALPSSPSIFRVNDGTRLRNEKFYDPKAVSIGPLHHGKPHLRHMEQHKVRFIKLLLQRQNESSADKYVMAIRSLEKKARDCYVGSFEFSTDEFVEMLLLDGCFIVEFMSKYVLHHLRESDDHIIFEDKQVLSQLLHDLMLVENQIPFFVVHQLFSMMGRGDYEHISELLWIFSARIYPWGLPCIREYISLEDVDHLHGLVYKMCCSSLATIVKNRPIKVLKEKQKMVAISSTTKLQKAEIKFKTDLGLSDCLNIKFIEGMMKIPFFHVSDKTESILRNIIAYECFFIDNQPKYVTDYVFFLHSLIKSAKDVEVLRDHGILTNLLGNDEMVYDIINRLGRNILMSSDFCYADVYEKVNKYYGRRWSRRMANLRCCCFSGRWAEAFFPALFLLMLTLFTLSIVLQAVLTVLSYVRK
ncbi:UNVERIFIED_CONTAM: hypothetical protein Sradi_3714000 [Sesamum radiatum]|uniref:Uncharacterized protein n=1 Tax=Sesamum radiatum TaxID=300843 RepID=A0AAW2PXS8_SESRA